MQPDIRWIQRFNNYQKALEQLTKFIAKGALNDLEEQGLIQAFEYTHDLAWKTLKDFLESKGVGQIFGSKDTSREAFKQGLVENGQTWMDMIQSRNLTSHTYNESTVKEIAQAVTERYYAQFVNLRTTLSVLAEKQRESE